MAEINANIVVEPFNIGVTQETTNLGVTVDSTSLNLYTTVAVAAGAVGELQYNNNGRIAGIPITTFDGNNLTLGDVSNVKLNGGNNTFFLQTDGTGNLTWAPGTVTANTGNGIASGANTQIQLTDGTGNFTSGAGFTFDNASNVLSVPGNVYIAGSITSDLEVVGNTTLGPLTEMRSASESFSTSTTTTGSINFNILDNSILYCTNSLTGNIDINFRGNAVFDVDDCVPLNSTYVGTIITINDATPYNITTVSIDSTPFTIYWAGGAAPNVAPYSYMSYTFTLVRSSLTSPTYTIFGTGTEYS